MPLAVMHGLLYDFNDNMFQTVDDPFGVGITTLNGINDLNQLVGFYMAANGNTIGPLADLAASPLPATLPLFAIGLSGLGLFGWRRKRKSRVS
jgi:hypothetical protein